MTCDPSKLDVACAYTDVQRPHKVVGMKQNEEDLASPTSPWKMAKSSGLDISLVQMAPAQL